MPRVKTPRRAARKKKPSTNEYAKLFDMLEQEFQKEKEKLFKHRVIERAGDKWDDECGRWMSLTDHEEKEEFATNVIRDANNYLNAFNRLVSGKLLAQVWEDFHGSSEAPLPPLEELRDYIITGLYSLAFAINMELLVECRRAGERYFDAPRSNDQTEWHGDGAFSAKATAKVNDERQEDKEACEEGS